jgi:hypothetical protein
MRLAGLPFLVLVACLTIAGLPSRARAAEGGDVATAVLGIEPLDGAPDAVAAEITDALRQRVAATKGYQLLQGKDLVEVKLVFACPDAAPACMSAAGKSLGADKLIFGNVKRAGNDYQLTLKLLDWQMAEQLPEHLFRIRTWGYKELHVRQLQHNRQEICVAALRG